MSNKSICMCLSCMRLSWHDLSIMQGWIFEMFVSGELNVTVRVTSTLAAAMAIDFSKARF